MILSKKQIGKALLIIPIVLVFRFLIVTGDTDLSVKTKLLMEIYRKGSFDGDSKDLIYVMTNLMYVIIFNILFGTTIYHHFQISGVYVFSRIENRKGWIYNKSLQLWFFALIYASAFVLTLLFLCSISASNGFGLDVILVCIELILLLSFFLTLSTLAINLLSIRFGSGVGFLIIFACMTALVTLLIKFPKIPVIHRYPFLLFLNPMGVTVINQEGNLGKVILSLLYQALLIIIIAIFGGRMVQKLDIALTDNENI